MKFGKILTYSVIGLASAGVIGGTGYIIGQKFDNANEKQSIYFSINNLNKIGKNNEFVFERNKKKELELTYNKEVYKYLGESVTSFKYGNGKTAVLCSTFGNGDNLVTLYYDAEELLYIHTKTSITLDNGNSFEKKMLYNANGEILFENQPFQLTDLLKTTFTYGDKQIKTQIDAGNQDLMIMSFNDGSYRRNVNNSSFDMSGENIENEIPRNYAETMGVSGPYKAYNFYNDNNSYICLYVVNDELTTVMFSEDHSNGRTETYLKVDDTVITEVGTPVVTIYDGFMYKDMFNLTKTENLSFELCESSVNGLIPVNITHNGVTYTCDNGNNLSTIDEAKFELMNSETGNSIIIYINRYDGSQIQYQIKTNGELSELVTENIVIRYSAEALVAGKTFQYVENETTRQFVFNETGEQVTIDGTVFYTLGSGRVSIVFNGQPIQLLFIEFKDLAPDGGQTQMFYVQENGNVYMTIETGETVQLQAVEV